MGQWSLDYLRTHHVSSSWQVDGAGHADVDNSTLTEIPQNALRVEKRYSAKFNNDAKVGTLWTKDKDTKDSSATAKKRREKRAMELLKQDDGALVKLENAAIEHSKIVDSAILGKYSIWRRDSENENSDSIVRLMRDQIIMARNYIILAKSKNRLDLYQELLTRIKESQRAVGEANTDGDLHHSAPEKIKEMGQVLSRAREALYDSKTVIQRLRVMLQSADDQVRSLKKQYIP